MISPRTVAGFASDGCKVVCQSAADKPAFLTKTHGMACKTGIVRFLADGFERVVGPGVQGFGPVQVNARMTLGASRRAHELSCQAVIPAGWAFGTAHSKRSREREKSGQNRQF